MKTNTQKNNNKKIARMTLDELHNEVTKQVANMGGNQSRHIRNLLSEIVVKSFVVPVQSVIPVPVNDDNFSTVTSLLSTLLSEYKNKMGKSFKPSGTQSKKLKEVTDKVQKDNLKASFVQAALKKGDLVTV